MLDGRFGRISWFLIILKHAPKFPELSAYTFRRTRGSLQTQIRKWRSLGKPFSTRKRLRFSTGFSPSSLQADNKPAAVCSRRQVRRVATQDKSVYQINDLHSLSISHFPVVYLLQKGQKQGIGS